MDSLLILLTYKNDYYLLKKYKEIKGKRILFKIILFSNWELYSIFGTIGLKKISLTASLPTIKKELG